ncbi:MBOAT family protein [Mycobacterium stomatepiae]|uniref:MBOAT family protein n=1 Tax=Mycobacterium stomatepiae TaxID=470076 RepID=UPI0013D73817|nr:MBOAT family protein [Mycobacterium stomatepiae]MCV7167437.1 MBOAT family protein [Mycobacterium stomatepiae]
MSWRLPPRWRATGITASGALILAVLSASSLLILAICAGWTFYVARRWIRRRGVLPIAVAVLAAFYAANLYFGKGNGDGLTQRVVLPLGMAFYVLRLVHYLFEAFKGNLRAHDFGEYLAYHFLPGSLPLGPIHRFDEFLRGWRRRRFDHPAFVHAMQRILYGLVKVVVVGNYNLGLQLSPYVAHWRETSGPLGSYLADLHYWTLLYVVFSGYSDIAIGFGALTGVTLRENFNWPFIARNISDFWQRWHMSLSSWCRDYVYIPVLAVSRRPSLALVSSMVILGLWHSLTLHYLLWGLYHGIGLAAHRRYRTARGEPQTRGPVASRVIQVATTVLTLNFVVLSFQVTDLVETWLLAGGV